MSASGNVVITGSDGTKTVAYAVGDTAKTVAQSINLVSDTTGVVANAQTDVDLTFTAAGSYQLELKGDNTTTVKTVTFDLSAGTGIESLAAAAQAFNDKSATTGITATVKDDGSGITLTHYEGLNISVNDTTFTNAGAVTVSGGQGTGSTTGTGSVTLAADGAVQSSIAVGQITFDSEKSFSIKDTGATTAVMLGSASSSTIQKVSEIDISTVTGGNLALSIVDAAIAQVSNQRAKFGALQSRFESTIRNLETSVENLSAARSRIQDADFAVETAELTRSQILQQAGTAMLAQANSIPQNVLSLLG
ncbi:MAG: flagellin [Gammaproteobacteria bacterium]|nr:flagellin [Gammaproteobacteria bacterium]